MTEKKVFELANRLLARTRAGTQHWEAGVSDQSFLTAFPKYSVKIGRVADADGENWLTVIWIYNEAGSEIEAAREDVLSEKLQGSSRTLSESLEAARVADVLKDLYEEARRSALNVEGALDDLLASMQ
ncbi:MAG TPA: hypothetical protein VN924_00990 [Bryobacteraceae bacterium]|jgi:hypothetical protein|nr:hypothetical protein [Bryobacteraceae bacterium]